MNEKRVTLYLEIININNRSVSVCDGEIETTLPASRILNFNDLVKGELMELITYKKIAQKKGLI